LEAPPGFEPGIEVLQIYRSPFLIAGPACWCLGLAGFTWCLGAPVLELFLSSTLHAVCTELTSKPSGECVSRPIAVYQD
jgi:hypothetical protein